MPGKEIPDRCMNCREAQPAFILRTRHVCQDCYVRFVKYKPFKRTENYRLRRNMPQDGPCKLLLPLSYGLSSTVLLHMLHEQIEAMRLKPHGPKGYELLVLTIDPSTISPTIPSHDEAFSLAEKLFPQCSFTTVPFHSIFDLDPNIGEVMSQYAHADFKDQTSLSNQERLEVFRASISTATSKVDIDNILINRLIVAFAQKMECRGIVWGDSDSKLAAKTLANVAKGRGSAVTWQVCDGMSPFGLEYNFPLRDLFTVELRNYASFFPELAELIIPHEQPSENTLTKNLSIDELMVRYVLTQGEKYPGVMLNVTRTASKLQSSGASSAGPQCNLCGALTFDANEASVAPQATGQHSDNLSSQICYACARSRPDLSC
ncbi:uncharacterized protein BP01DRAFT_94377 [Aspergillus saccharolyticus JOP 1030-1]|uniref:Cytoplasmic tRNA 2-thiolation protein 2 n=1 Tax=Aspergillus saccharolyticus JOP 1030-1 TaxID=1450539 RepID=A0A318Z980_9EURO|nr:cytoplasmic tRNA 2-thiolation protein 2 [Aspergillus saccharolyticus JOP 1030-1]PYH43866.1 cytoplasmic tRNA 2-thiolation protein 2 [Aspergillus saccharolyticus JOP 1030-1]